MSLSLQRLKSTLLKDSLIYVAGEMTAKAVPFLLLPYLTRQLGTAGFGALSYYLSITAFLHNGWLIAAFALYGVTTIAWVWVLRHAPLHLAYPFMGLAFLIVPTLAWAFLGEPLHWRTIAGGALIMVGVTLAATS